MFNIAKVCLGFEIYDVRLADIFLANFLYLFKNLAFRSLL